MLLEQFYLDCLAQASYLIADETTRVACVVDPRRDVDVYCDFARDHGLEIRHAVLTHIHADFLAGHLELAKRCGAQIVIGRAAETEFDARGVGEGDRLDLGPEVHLGFLETPGHTPEGLCILVYEGQADAPKAVLSGDTLFAGDVGRPDLLVSRGLGADELAGMLYDSLHGKLMRLDDDTVLYPGHGAGSACGKNISKETVTTIGQQRQWNWALQPMTREEFVRRMLADLPAPPAYFGHDATLNRQRRDTLDEVLARSLAPLTLADFDPAAVQILDTRSPDEYAAGHYPGSINIGLDGTFASWAGTVLDPERPIALITARGREEESAMRLGRIGYDRIAGVLEISQLGPLRTQTRISSDEMLDVAERGTDFVLDVRRPAEYLGGSVEGSVNIPLAELRQRQAEIPRDRPIVVFCQGGYRSMIASSLLRAAGHRNVRDLRGGYSTLES